VTDGGTWQPPDPTTAAPVPEPAPPGRSRGKIVGAAVGALAIVGAGTFAVARIAGDDAAGGAATPEDAGLAFVEAIGNEDLLGVVDVLLPGERDALGGPLSDIVDELQRLEVLSDDADESAISGVDFEFEDVSVDADATNVDDIANLTIDATVTGSVNGEELPVGEWLRDELGDELDELDETDTTEGESLNITAVEEDGRWYLSWFYTSAENAREEAGGEDIPGEGVTPAGGDSPEAALDVLLDAVEELDLEALIAGLDPNEAQALQRYAPLFLDDAQAELDEVPLEITVDDRSYRVEGSGDTRSVVLDGVTIEATAEGDTVTMALRDGCWIVNVPDAEETNSCDSPDEVPALDDVFEDPEAIEDFLADVREAFADYENPGLVVSEVDGSWYLSPIATGSEQLLAVVRSLTREEIEELQAQFDDVAAAFENVVVDEEEELSSGDGEETIDPAEECWIESDARAATTCFDALVAAGEIEASSVPWYLRNPECGLADLGWNGDYYSLPDAEFTATVEEAAPCFQELVESGEVSEFDLPVEILHPECLFGRNWYATTDDDYLQEFEDCAFG
jgi:hypothetical protein